MAKSAAEYEIRFGEFIETFQGGRQIREIIPDIPDNYLNADYFFEKHEIICELKILEKDVFSSEDFAKRIIAAYKHYGHSQDRYLAWLFRKENFPDDVNRRLFTVTTRSIKECILKASKQIISTRKLINNTSAKGLIIIGNCGNFSFTADQINVAISKAFEQTKDHAMNAILHFSLDVSYHMGEMGHREIWVPIANNAGVDMQEFMDAMGSAWFDAEDSRLGITLDRRTGQDFDLLVDASPIRPDAP